MNIWPFNKLGRAISKATTTTTPSVVVSQVRSRPDYWTAYSTAESYLSPPNDPGVFKILRQSIPILNAAVDQLVRMTGNVEVHWESERVQTAWDEWTKTVHVAPITTGLNEWLNGYLNRYLTYGTGASEIVVDSTGKDIYGFSYISADTLRLRSNPENPLDVIVAQQQSGSYQPVVLDRDMIALSSHKPRDESPYGQSMFADIPFVGELLLEMVHAEKMNWIRRGSPSHAIILGIPQGLDPSIDVQGTVTQILSTIESDWTESMKSRQTKGTIKDFFAAGDVKIVTIGADAKPLEFNIPWRGMLEQVVAVTHLPPWLLGLHWSSTERLSEEQAQALEYATLDYQGDMVAPVSLT